MAADFAPVASVRAPSEPRETPLRTLIRVGDGGSGGAVAVAGSVSPGGPLRGPAGGGGGVVVVWMENFG